MRFSTGDAVASDSAFAVFTAKGMGMTVLIASRGEVAAVPNWEISNALLRSGLLGGLGTPARYDDRTGEVGVGVVRSFFCRSNIAIRSEVDREWVWDDEDVVARYGGFGEEVGRVASDDEESDAGRG